jgi:hypothetical protein
VDDHRQVGHADEHRLPLLQQGDEVIPVLEDLGILVMRPAVGAYATRMSGRAGARQVSSANLADTLLDSGLR